MRPRKESAFAIWSRSGRVPETLYAIPGQPIYRRAREKTKEMKPYYEHDGITIYHGDVLDIISSMPMVDAIVTDPPYSSGGMYRSDRSKDTNSKYQLSKETNRTYDTFSGDNRDQRTFEKWFTLWSRLALDVVNPHGGFVSFIDWRNLSSVIDSVQIAGWTYAGLTPWHKGTDQRPIKGWFRLNVEYLVWSTKGSIKKGCYAEGNCLDGIFYHRINVIEKFHQTGKPIELMRSVLLVRQEWKTFLDPFMGSGTTLRAAKDLRLSAIGIEKEEANCEIAANRMQQEVMQFGEDARAGQGECPGTACNSAGMQVALDI